MHDFLRTPITRLFVACTLGLLPSSMLGCGGDGEYSVNNCGAFDNANCVRVPGGDSDALLTAVNTLTDDTVVILGPGEYVLDNQVTIRANDVALVGQGMDLTTLVFTGSTTQFNGVDAVSDGFLVQDFTVLDAPKDGIRVEDSDGVTFRRIRATWTNEGRSTNGAYGIYPVKSRDVLVEDSEAFNASDAGLYVGQCERVNVRRNLVMGNVAGLEIENTQYADVYDNVAEDNTTGIVVFDLPGNPIAGRDVRLRDNTIRRNNRRNFAPGGTVAIVPAGLGTFVMASRRVVIENNTYENNNSLDIIIVSGLVIQSDETVWELETATLQGDWDDLGLAPGATAGTVMNYRTEDVVIANNSHSRERVAHDFRLEYGQLLSLLFPEGAPAVVYGGIEESMFNATDATMTSNDNRICVGDNGAGIANINLESQLDAPPTMPILELSSSALAPYDCTSFTPELVTVEL